MQPLQVTIFIIGTVVVVFGAYYVTYFIGAKASGQSRRKARSRKINMLDRFALSKDKSFCVIEIAGKVYVVGVTNQSMTVLDTLDAADFSETEAERPNAARWPMASGKQQDGGLTNRIVYYMAGKMRKRREKGGYADTKGGTFADNMRAARDKDASARQEYKQAERSDDREDT